jgi:hypothetical protein
LMLGQAYLLLAPLTAPTARTTQRLQFNNKQKSDFSLATVSYVHILESYHS